MHFIKKIASFRIDKIKLFKYIEERRGLNLGELLFSGKSLKISGIRPEDDNPGLKG